MQPKKTAAERELEQTAADFFTMRRLEDREDVRHVLDRTVDAEADEYATASAVEAVASMLDQAAYDEQADEAEPQEGDDGSAEAL